MRRSTSAVALFLCVAFAAPPALADAVEQAKALFDGGAAMYEKAHYLEAIQAFEAAYKLAPRPGILFSIAQAHKKQFFFDKNPEDLREALRAYREYVEKTPSGGRRAEAVASIAELEPYTARYDMSKVAAAPAPRTQTVILVQANAPGIQVTVDGQPASDETLHWPVAAGKHVVRATAPGYAPEEQEVALAEGEYRPVVLTMRELPARVTIDTLSGAQVSIDGRLTGTTPLLRPLELEPGTHLVTVTKNGHRPYSGEIEFHHAEVRTLAIARTGQRYASYVAFGTALAGAAAGGVFAALAFHEQTLAQNIVAERQAGTQNPGQSAQYAGYVDARSTDRLVAGGFFAGALAVGATGLILFAFDQPAVGGPETGAEKKTKTPLVPTVRPAREMEVSLFPALAPGALGGSITGRF